MHFNKKVKAALTAVVLCFAAAGAYAYWTGSGSGSGTAAVGTSSTVTITAIVDTGIAPGTNRAVSFTAANTSSSPIFVTTVHLVSKVADAQHAACGVTDMLDFTMADVTVNHEVPALATAESLGTTGSLVYANTAVTQDACKGATLTLTLTST